ncbi:hypothetical protein DTO217A2_3182 [Paecilomyces variotii]|nr:hypothetical protein DTO217A2_3182 [Paecilomyces variotii]
MKFNLFVLSGLLAFAAAADSTSSSASATASLSPEASCAAKCAASDVCCKAQCYKVPCPNDAMANDTTACAAACPQGSGTPADTQKYAQCQQSCFSSLFFPATASGDSSNGQATVASTTGSGAYVANTAKAQATSSGSSSSSSDSSSDSKSGSKSDSGSSSGTSSASSTKSTSNAADHLQLGVSAAGLMAVVAAAMAL